MRLIPERSPLVRLLLCAALPVTLGGLLLARLVPDVLLRAAHCPLRDLTSIPCPTCGGTLAATRLAMGQGAAAWAANPLVVAAAAGLLAAGLWAAAATLAPVLRRQPALSAREKRAAVITAALLILANWLWLMLRSR